MQNGWCMSFVHLASSLPGGMDSNPTAATNCGMWPSGKQMNSLRYTPGANGYLATSKTTSKTHAWFAAGRDQVSCVFHGPDAMFMYVRGDL